MVDHLYKYINLIKLTNLKKKLINAKFEKKTRIFKLSTINQLALFSKEFMNT